jgi:hypothetical protein
MDVLLPLTEKDMNLNVVTINWEDDTETNFPHFKVPELEIEPGTKLHDELIAIIRRESKEKVWTSLVITILPN